jgi:hypothetical protein
MNFIPNQEEEVVVPYWDDVTAEEGWKGRETEKSLDKLKREVTESISRLGGNVTRFIQGTFVIGEHQRGGFVIEYYVPVPNSEVFRGRISVAALPVRPEDFRVRTPVQKRMERSLKLALFNVRDALDSSRILQILSPGYNPLVPFMLGTGDKTISQLWEERIIGKMLPPPDADFVEGEEV